VVVQLNKSWIGGFLRSQASMVLACILYVAVFVLVYKGVIVPLWEYEGFHSRATLSRAAVGWVLAALPSLWMPINLKRPSQVAYWLLYLLVVVPVCLIPIYALEDQSGGPVLLAACVVAVFALMGLIYRLPLLPVPRVHLESYEFSVILILLSTTFYALQLSSFGLHFHFVPLKEIYAVRAEYDETLRRASPLVAYAIGWQMYVINPLIIAKGLASRRILPILAGVVGQFLIYSITGYRDVFFSATFLLYLLWMMRREGKRFGTRFAATWTAIFLAAGALKFFGSLTTLEALVKRTTATPGLLTAYYYDFFSWHPKALLGHSIFKSFVDYPYALQPPYLIGYVYFHNVGMDANANVWADAYANFGYPGIVCFTCLLAIVLWLYDSMAAGRDLQVAALVIALPAFALANTSLLTTLLSHGMGLALLLVYLMPPTVFGYAQHSYVLVHSADDELRGW
jgi:hypothetical protein